MAGVGARKRWLDQVFPDAPPEVRAELSGRIRRARFGGGDVVVAQGEPTDAFYIVTAGEAEVVRDGVYAATLGRGDFFGEVGILRATPRTATVRAVRRLEVLTLDRDAFAAVAHSSELTAQELQRVLRRRSAAPEARDDAVPLPPWSRLLRRVGHHPLARHYNRLVAAVLLLNVVFATAIADWTTDGLAVLAQGNIALAVVSRQQSVINLLCRAATWPPPTWPLRLRWALAKYHHHGGLHVGCALAGTAWSVAFTAALLADGDAPAAARASSVAVAVLLAVIVALAAPQVRHRLHDSFEASHRFCGWAAIVLVWVSAVLLHPTLGDLVGAPANWLLVGATLGVAWPWLRLRRVRIDVERPSSHVAVVTLHGQGSPRMGSTRPVSRHPLWGWHQFAVIPAAPGGDGHRMAVSRAGDWTSAFIDRPPSHLWVRGVPTTELTNVWRLFRKVVIVTTGSGIAPAVGHLLDPDIRSRLVWVTRAPRRTYGDALVDEILTAQPDATIWNTDELGKPDVLRLAYGAYLDADAEAVVCISNRAVTERVVHELERRGIPAFGPIFDS